MQNPASVSDDYSYLRFTVGHLRESLTTTEELFSPKNANFPELLIFAPEFFGLVQRLLRDNVFLSVAKLLDKKKEVLGLDQLIRKHANGASQKKLLERVEALRKRAASIIKQRHDAVAHLNYDFARGFVASPPIPIQEMNSIISEVEKILADFQTEFLPKNFGISVEDSMGRLIPEMLRKIKSANLLHLPYEPP